MQQYDKNYFQRYPLSGGIKGKIFSKVIRKKEPIFRFLTSNCKKGRRLLDLGCGEGYFLGFAEKYFKCVGIDISSYAISRARENAKNCDLYQGDCKKLSQFKDGSFDMVTAFDVLEHLTQSEKAIKEIKRILKNEGLFIFSTPNLDSFGHRIKKEKWVGFKDITHYSVRPKKEWEETLKKNDFQIIKLFYDYLWDVPYTHFIPRPIEELFIKLPTFILFWLGIGSGKYLGENIWIIAKKS